MPEEEGREEDVPEEGRLRRRRADGQEEAFQTKHSKTLDILSIRRTTMGPRSSKRRKTTGLRRMGEEKNNDEPIGE